MLLQSFRQVGDRVVTRFVLPMILVRVGFGSAKRMAGGGKYFVNEGVVNVNRAVFMCGSARLDVHVSAFVCGFHFQEQLSFVHFRSVYFRSSSHGDAILVKIKTV